MTEINVAPTLSRRTVLAGTGAVALSPLSATARGASKKVLQLFVGTFNTSTTRGLTPFTLRLSDDSWALGTTLPDIQNASFGVYGPRHGLQYLVDEQDKGRLAAYRVSAHGTAWERLADVPSMGSNPAFITLDEAETCLVTANYNSGTVALYRLDPNTGLPLEPPDVMQDAGHGPNTDRQQGPHAHCARFSPDQRFLYTVDLGTDEVVGYPFDTAKPALNGRFTAFHATPGSGPRHIIFHPHRPFAYLVAEIGSLVTALRRYPDGRLEQMQILSTLPPDFTAHNQAAHIAMNRAGSRLYISNRGHNSIAVFAIAPSGKLTLLQHSSTGGDWPRFFLLLEDHKRLIVANERSGTLVLFHAAADGTLQPTGKSLSMTEAVYVGRTA
ncbi:MAG: lactonase family protein [Alphaproteobacteria bacterium]|nr:lactonase family protein [Alphaproteobacteria bacterium]MDE2264808.1 lactonase family protein [Alphaproteobacteria bacterium]MDE2499825.1 lactonase family protein [Alphaproteobacteria bacterium]